MLYPQKLNSKKSDVMIIIAILISIDVGGILILINHFATPNIHWAGLSNAGIIYIWITVLYAINHNTNIAGYVLLETSTISLLTSYIDYKTGCRGWSMSLAIPIILIVANITMFVLTIVSHKKYIRYAIYQLIICILSLLPLYFALNNFIQHKVMSFVLTGISAVNFIVTICLCARDVKDDIIRKFHLG